MTAGLIICIISLVANMALLGLLLEEKQTSKFWKSKYDNARKEANEYLRKITRTY